MHIASRTRKRTPWAFLLALVACLAFPVQALALDEVTVRVEGEAANLLIETKVPIGNGSGWAQPWNKAGELPGKCKDNTAYQAIENATKGQWDRQLFAETIKSEKHTFGSGEEYWVFYYNNNYADWGACEQKLKNGDKILMQAAVSGPAPNYIPESVPIAIDPVEPPSEIVEAGPVTLHVSAWIPEDIFGVEDEKFPGHWIIPPSPKVNGAGYTVKAGGEEGVTNGSGNVTLNLEEEEGEITVQASKPGSTTNWSRAIPIDICVENGLGVC